MEGPSTFLVFPFLTWLYFTLLYTLLRFTSLHFTSFHLTFLYFTLLYFTLLYLTLLDSTLLLKWSKVQCTLLHFTSLYFTLLLFTLLYFTFKWADWRRRARGLRGFDSESVDFRSLTGSKQTINRRLTLDDSGDLMIHNTTFGDAGRFMCIVQNVRFFSGIIHNLRIECKFYF